MTQMDDIHDDFMALVRVKSKETQPLQAHLFHLAKSKKKKSN